MKIYASTEYVEESIDQKIVQADWNQNDSSLSSYIQNRPMGYTEAIVAKGTYVFTVDHLYGSKFRCSLNSSESIFGDAEVGAAYEVIWDGTPYVCRLRKYTYHFDAGGTQTFYGMGNPALYTGNGFSASATNIESDEPFFFYPFGMIADDLYTTEFTTVSHSVYVRGIAPLAGKFLPLDARSDWSVNTEDDIRYIAHRPMYTTAELLFDKTCTFAKASDSELYYCELLVEPRVLFDQTIGDMCTVVWDDIVYQGAIHYDDFKSADGSVDRREGLGNPELYALGQYTGSESYDEPFYIGSIGYTLTSEYIHLCTADPSSTHSVRIYLGTGFSKLKPEFVTEAVRGDWAEGDEHALGFIKNKPEIPSIEGLSTVAYVDEQVAGVSERVEAVAAVQADWNETDETSGAYIKNKPTVGSDGSIQADWSETDESSGAFIKNKPTIAQADWNEADEAAAGFILNKPEIPDAQVASDWSNTDPLSKTYIKNKPFGPADDLVGETTGTMKRLSDLNYWQTAIDYLPLTLGHTYHVYWNGVLYECVAKDPNDANDNITAAEGSAYLGSFTHYFGMGWGEDTGEPFVICFVADDENGSGSIGTSTECTEATFRIVDPSAEEIKIDAKYLPDDFAVTSSALPEVTSDDDGKVLTVVDGEWRAAGTSKVEAELFSGTYDFAGVTAMNFGDGSSAIVYQETVPPFSFADGSTYTVTFEGNGATLSEDVTPASGVVDNLSRDTSPFTVQYIDGVLNASWPAELGANPQLQILQDGNVILSCNMKYQSESQNSSGVAMYDGAPDVIPGVEMIAGNEYIVYWDNVRYEVAVTERAASLNGLVFNMTYFGDGTIFDNTIAENEYPFVCGGLSGGATGWQTRDTSAQHSVKLCVMEEQVDGPVDWDVLDPADPGYIKNKPFGVLSRTREVVIEANLSTFDKDEAVTGADMMIVEAEGSSIGLCAGTTYIAVIDDNEYEVTASTVMGTTCIGNLGLYGVGDDTGEPFLALDVPGEGWMAGICADEQAVRTISGTSTVLESQEITGFVADSSGLVYTNGAQSPAQFTITGSTTSAYRVTWDGVEYICWPQQVQYNGVTIYGVGDAQQAGGSGNGEPFAILYFPDSSSSQIVAFTPEGSHTVALEQGSGGYIRDTYVAVYEQSDAIKQIDQQFIPDLPWGKISEKPFGLVPARTIVAQVDAAFTAEDDGVFMAMCGLDMLESNKKYIVSWDGNEFVSTSQVTANNKDGFMLVTGNMAQCTSAGADTGEPFAICQIYDNGNLFTYVTSNAVQLGTTVAVTIMTAEDEIATLDPAFVPAQNQVVFAKRTIDFSADNDPFFYGEQLNLVGGAIYTVLWDDVRYQCVAVDLSDEVVAEGLTDAAGAAGCCALEVNGVFDITSLTPAVAYTAFGVNNQCMIVTSSDTLTHTVEIVCGGVQDSAIRDVLEETELTFQDAGGLYLWNSTDTVVPLTPGLLYFVEFNNARYECVAETRLFGEILGVGIGNASIVGLGDDTGEPFLFGTMIDNSMSACYCSLGAGAYKMSIDAMKVVGMPEVTSDDNGKTLSVVDGKWVAVEAGPGLPEVTTDDNDKVLQVVDGSWQTVALADSAIAAYIDSYIDEALGGEY